MVFEHTKAFLCNKGIAHWGNTITVQVCLILIDSSIPLLPFNLVFLVWCLVSCVDSPGLRAGVLDLAHAVPRSAVIRPTCTHGCATPQYLSPGWPSDSVRFRDLLVLSLYTQDAEMHDIRVSAMLFGEAAMDNVLVCVNCSSFSLAFLNCQLPAAWDSSD